MADYGEGTEYPTLNVGYCVSPDECPGSTDVVVDFDGNTPIRAVSAIENRQALPLIRTANRLR